jgi:hypothetical protein
MTAKVHLNYAVLHRLVESDGTDRARKDLAEAIAQKVRDQNIEVGDIDDNNGLATTISIPVIVSEAGNVILAHPAGIAVEAKYGALVKAAAAVGLEVNG